MIYCCGGCHTPLKTVFLPANFRYRDRKLEVLVCPICGSLVAELVQFDVRKNKYETYRPTSKQTVSFIKDVQAGKWREIKIKYGTKGNAGFVYGVNKQRKNGKIYQYAVDFNGTKKLVKVIDVKEVKMG